MEKTRNTQISMDAGAPVMEPQRQFYYMDLAKRLIKEREKACGRKLTAHVETFGCQMNARDSEKLRGILDTIGYVQVDTEEADFVIYNTCTVRENANNKVYGRLGTLGNYKKKNPEMMIALCGCMMQEAHVVERKSSLLSTSGRIRQRSWRISPWSGNTDSNPVSISCSAATISAAIVLFPTCAGVSEAVNRKILSVRSNGWLPTVLWK